MGQGEGRPIFLPRDDRLWKRGDGAASPTERAMGSWAQVRSLVRTTE